MNKMNRRGNLPEVVLMISAIVLTVLGLIVFASFSGGFAEKSKEYSSMIDKANFNERYIIERAKFVSTETINCTLSEFCGEMDMKKRYSRIAEKRDLQIDGQGNFYGKVRNGDFKFARGDEGEYLLNITQVFVSAESGAATERTKNSITRNFDICMKFDDKSGVFKGNC
jgi:hypothetical protein